MSLSDFKTQRVNANKHTERGIKALDNSISKDGWIGAVTVAADGETFDGSARLEALADAMPSAEPIVIESDGTRPVIVKRTDIPDTDDPRAKRLGVAANVIAHMDYAPDGEILAMIAADDDALARLIKQDELSADAVAAALAYGLLGDADAVDNTARQIFNNNAIIDAAFTYFRATGFPYRKLPIHVCMQDINKLAGTDADNLFGTDTAYHVADTYHPHRFHASAEKMRSQIDAFNDDVLLRHALELDLRYGEIGLSSVNKLQIVHGTQPCSNFRPGFALLMYRRFCNPDSVILDTSTGYGGRLVGFMASGCARYIGIDPNVPTHEGNTRMAADLGFSKKVELYNLPAEDVSHDALQGRCDFAFTSPPYFAKEHYSDDDTQSWKRYSTGEAWRDGFLLPMLRLQYAALKDGCFNVVNIADVKLRGKVYPLVDWTIEGAKSVGFEHVKTEKFNLTRRFGAGQDEEVAFEPVLIFKRVSNGTA